MGQSCAKTACSAPLCYHIQALVCLLSESIGTDQSVHRVRRGSNLEASPGVSSSSHSRHSSTLAFPLPLNSSGHPQIVSRNPQSKRHHSATKKLHHSPTALLYSTPPTDFLSAHNHLWVFSAACQSKAPLQQFPTPRICLSTAAKLPIIPAQRHHIHQKWPTFRTDMRTGMPAWMPSRTVRFVRSSSFSSVALISPPKDTQLTRAPVFHSSTTADTSPPVT